MMFLRHHPITPFRSSDSHPTPHHMRRHRARLTKSRTSDSKIRGIIRVHEEFYRTFYVWLLALRLGTTYMMYDVVIIFLILIEAQIHFWQKLLFIVVVLSQVAPNYYKIK
jgi:hypothetical protein